MPRRKRVKLELPPLPEQEALERAVDRICRMTPDEVFETSVRAGIYTPDGQLTEPYGGPPPRRRSPGKPRKSVRARARISGDLVGFSDPEWVR